MGMWALDGDLLRTLVAVVDCGSFGNAALRRHITQSTVSQQMKRLEEQVGRGLFAAAGRRRVLTGDGELLLGYARRILALRSPIAAAVMSAAAMSAALIPRPGEALRQILQAKHADVVGVVRLRHGAALSGATEEPDGRDR